MRHQQSEERIQDLRNVQAAGGNKPKTEETISRFQKASCHIITQRTFRQSWFSKSPHVEVEIKELGKVVDELLKQYEEYFDNVIQREPWSEATSKHDFKKITEEVLNTDEEHYNWTRVAMLLALAIRVAQHFQSKGASSDFVKQFAKDVGTCIEDRINSWGQSSDRWAQLRPAGTSPSETNGKKFYHFVGVGAFALSFLATVTQLTTSSPVFINKLR